MGREEPATRMHEESTDAFQVPRMLHQTTHRSRAARLASEQVPESNRPFQSSLSGAQKCVLMPCLATTAKRLSMFKLAKLLCRCTGERLSTASSQPRRLSIVREDVRLEVSGFSNVQASSLFIPSWVIIRSGQRARLHRAQGLKQVLECQALKGCRG